jgi:hypothetical protein
MRGRLAVGICLVFWLACAAHSNAPAPGGAGTTGSAGAAGTTGTAGSTGSAGTTGTAGSTGSASTTGTAGSTGSASTTGSAGTGIHQTEDGLLGSGGGFGTTGPGAMTGMLGNWLYATGKTTRVCPGEAGTDAPPEGEIVVNAGASDGELVVDEPGACSLHFTRSGDVATIAPGQACAGADGAGGTITFSNMTWTLTLSADGKTLTEALTADETLAPAQGTPRTCKFTESDVTLKRAL